MTKTHSSSVAEIDVLFVDDHEGVRLQFARHCEALGAMCELASSVDEALPVLEREAVTHIICDLAMPGPSSVAFLLAAKRKNPGVNCVLLSGQLFSLSAEDRNRLLKSQVKIQNKDEITGRGSIATLLGVPFSDEDERDDTPPATSVDESAASARDVVVSQRLEIDSLRRRAQGTEQSGSTAEDPLQSSVRQLFVEWLRQEAGRPDPRLWLGHQSLAIADLRAEVEAGSELGNELLASFVEDLRDELR